MTAQPLLSIENLSVVFNRSNSAVNDISITVNAGETFALVGESGSGKSITALSVLRLLPNNARLTAAAITLKGENLLAKTEAEFCAVRGKRIGLIFQDPMASFNPVMTIGDQLAEAIQIHTPMAEQELNGRVLELLRQVEIPEPERRTKDFPHQLSGGQRQRVMIAIALAGNPDLLIADEPTTSLDVTIQAQILDLLKNIQNRTGMALWFISHDLALVSEIAERVAVMHQGKIVETGLSAEVFANPKHPYTQKLLDALPRLQSGRLHPSADKPPLLKVSDFHCHYPIRKGLFKRIKGYVRAVDGVSFSVQEGKTLALVGESGCGKTTLGKSLLNLIPKSSGAVEINGIDLTGLKGGELRRRRAEMQIIFQDPFSSMNPRMLVGDIIAEGLRALHPDVGVDERRERVRRLLRQVGLPETSALRYPHEFSGGQRQRICIARALAVMPKLIICDEPTSALDVSVQKQIIELLKTLQREHGISYIFITHDLAVVAEIADEVAVMRNGKIIEHGGVEQVLFNPVQDYTRKLLAAVPVLQEKL